MIWTRLVFYCHLIFVAQLASRCPTRRDLESAKHSAARDLDYANLPQKPCADCSSWKFAYLCIGLEVGLQARHTANRRSAAGDMVPKLSASRVMFHTLPVKAGPPPERPLLLSASVVPLR